MARSGRWLLAFAVAVAVVGLLFVRLPTAFVPNEDQGYFFVQVQAPPGATQQRTGVVLDDVAQYLLTQESASVDAAFIINGNNFSGRGQSQGMVYVHLRDWGERSSKKQAIQGVIARTTAHFATYKDAAIIAVNPAPIRGLGTSAGFDFELEDRGGVGYEALRKAKDELLAQAAHDPSLAQVRFNGVAENPAFAIDVDREKASVLGVALSDIDQTFSIAWGSRYVNNFLDTDNRIKRVYVQADAPFRMNPEDLGKLYVRNSNGAMVAFSSFATGRWTYGPPQLAALQRRGRHGDPGPGRRWQERRAGDARHGSARQAAAARHRLRVDGTSRCSRTRRDRRRRTSTRCRSSWCS